MKRPAIFLDRDGTLIEDVGYPHRPQDLRLLPGVIPALRKLQGLDFALVIVTNQSGIARGYFTEPQMHDFHAALSTLLRDSGIALAGIYHCPFHPQGEVAEYRCESPLRKPLPGMLLAAARELGLELTASYAIGDKLSDVLAGQAAGCRTVLVQTGAAGRGEPELAAIPDFIAADLLAAAGWIEVSQSTGIPPAADCAYPAAESL